jgi:hypothetical protein
MSGSKGSWCVLRWQVALELLRQSRKKKQRKKASPQQIDGQTVEVKRAAPSEITGDLPVHWCGQSYAEQDHLPWSHLQRHGTWCLILVLEGRVAERRQRPNVSVLE